MKVEAQGTKVVMRCKTRCSEQLLRELVRIGDGTYHFKEHFGDDEIQPVS